MTNTQKNDAAETILCTLIFDDEIRYCAGDMWVAVKLPPQAPVYRDFRSQPLITVRGN